MRSAACDIRKLPRCAERNRPMSISVILVFAFGTDLLRLRNVGSFRQKCSGRCTPHEVRRWPPCPGRAKRDLGPRVTRRHVSTVHRFCRLALGPGSSLSLRARSSGTRGRWRALFAQAAHNAALPIFPSHDVKQRSVGRSRGAFVRPGSRFFFRTRPEEGWAERRQAHIFCCRVCETRRIRACEARRVP